jgi:hypothetical protein
MTKKQLKEEKRLEQVEDKREFQCKLGAKFVRKRSTKSRWSRPEMPQKIAEIDKEKSVCFVVFVLRT